MEVGSGKRQSNHTIVMEDSIKTANSIVIRILVESVSSDLRRNSIASSRRFRVACERRQISA